jgi:type II secretory pathway component PulL
VITSEELRVAALAASAKRGKWVARRRVFRRWLGWLAWSIVLPVFGLLSLMAILASFAFWHFMGHDAAYAAAQQWVQQEFGSFKTSRSSENMPHNTHQNSAPTSHSTSSINGSMINLTDEANPDLQIDRNLTIKAAPNQ